MWEERKPIIRDGWDKSASLQSVSDVCGIELWCCRRLESEFWEESSQICIYELPRRLRNWFLLDRERRQTNAFAVDMLCGADRAHAPGSLESHQKEMVLCLSHRCSVWLSLWHRHRHEMSHRTYNPRKRPRFHDIKPCWFALWDVLRVTWLYGVTFVPDLSWHLHGWTTWNHGVVPKAQAPFHELARAVGPRPLPRQLADVAAVQCQRLEQVGACLFPGSSVVSVSVLQIFS